MTRCTVSVLYCYRSMTIALVAVFILPYVTYVVINIYIVRVRISMVLINYPLARRIIYAYICSIHICIL